MTIGDITSVIEQFAPLALQEDYDNAGMQIGDKSQPCTGVLLCVDVSPAIVDEAIERGCNLIVSHHPLIFRGLKRLVGDTPQQLAIIKAVSNGVSIYSAHTNLDSTRQGVSMAMAQSLGVKEPKVLARQGGKLLKLSTMVPNAHAEVVRSALFNAGAGRLGNYDSCSFSVKGEGTFRAKSGANPYVGALNELHIEPEVRIDVILPTWLRNKVEQELLNAHPYEVPAYEFICLDNLADTGLGAIGNVDEPLTPEQLVSCVKTAFRSPIVRCSAIPQSTTRLQRIAMCGGSGSSLINNAIAAGAQAFITSDVRYHDFVDYSDRIFIIDIGHFESEECTKRIFYHIVSEKFPNFAVYNSEIEKNPINYL